MIKRSIIIFIFFMSVLLTYNCKTTEEVEVEFDIRGQWNSFQKNDEGEPLYSNVHTFSGNVTSGSVISTSGSTGEYTVTGRSVYYYLERDDLDLDLGYYHAYTEIYGTATDDNNMSGTWDMTVDYRDLGEQRSFNGTMTADRIGTQSLNFKVKLSKMVSYPLAM